jgi:hypothetical protein
MKLKAKPKKPTKKNTLEFNWYGGESLQELIDWADEHNLEYSSIDIYTGDGEVCGRRLETDEEFSARHEAYEKRLATWEEWYKENKTEVDAKLREKEEKAKVRAAKKSTIVALRVEVERLQSELEQLQFRSQ